MSVKESVPDTPRHRSLRKSTRVATAKSVSEYNDSVESERGGDMSTPKKSTRRSKSKTASPKIAETPAGRRKSVKVSKVSTTKEPVSKGEPTGEKQETVTTEILEIVFCVVGIYTCFLTWGLRQEALSKERYNGEKFSGYMILSVMQYLISILVATVYINLTRQKFDWPTRKNFKYYAQCAVYATAAPHFGYESLKHIDYLTNILGKSCKLIPVVLMKFLLFGQLVETFKLISIFLVTLGVSLFMYFKDAGSATKTAAIVGGSGSLFGIALLSINLIIDGITNSTQDYMFKNFKIKGASMMVIMNALCLSLVASYLALWPAGRDELRTMLPIIFTNEHLQFDMLTYCICGAVGQCFIYYTIEKFGSVTLVTITVTRKMASIILSIFWYKHNLNSNQWLSVLLVFAGILLESVKSINAKRAATAPKKVKAKKN